MAQTDGDALVALYRATGGVSWHRRGNWDTDADLVTWDAVDFNHQGRVVKLWLNSNNLEGEIPATLGQLGSLQKLDLKSNKLSGCIPKELGGLRQLQTLWLCRNQLTGEIPATLGHLANLQKLYLSGNDLSGEIPGTLGQLGNLQKLHLESNQLSGCIPKELGGLRQLQTLWLCRNQLTGEIPATLGQLGKLKQLNLSFNKLSGEIPGTLGQLSILKELDVKSNQLSGEIPATLGQLGNLQELNLSGNDLSGEIPATLGQLGNLQELHLESNKLSGCIPKELGGLRQLQTLALSNNQLAGEIPASLGQLANLQELKLNRNKHSGEIPVTLGLLGSLIKLDLDWNMLSGRIPKELGNLGCLRWLDLRGNQLSGVVAIFIFVLYADLQAAEGDTSSSGSLTSVGGPIPLKLQKHPRFGLFKTGLAVDGPPLPAITDELHAIKILIVPVVLGYADLASDLYTAVSYYKTEHFVWFGLGLFFALGPAVIVSLFFLSGVGWFRRFLVATQLSLLAEALKTVHGGDYSPVLALVRVVGPLFESVPQLLLQLYAMLRLWTETSSSSSRLAWRVVSVCISAASLTYAATDVSSVERLLNCGGGNDGERFRLGPRCSSLTGVVFSRVPAEGTSSLRGLGNVHPRSHVWLCFVYHVLEIVARFVPLAMLVLVVGGWFFFVLVYLWVSRGLIIWMKARESLDFRFRVRLAAMPFLDSIMDETAAFGIALVLTLVEFIVCTVIYHVYKHDDLPSRARLVLVTVASCCMVGKMCLAWVAISPLKMDGGYSESQGDGGLGDRRGSAVTDGSVADVEMSAIEDG